MSAFAAVLRRDLRLALRGRGESMTAVAFFVLAAILFPFGVGPEPAVLARIAAGVIWATALLAALLSLDRLFRDDYGDGSLDLLLLAPLPAELAVVAKAAAHWLATGLPLTAAALVLGLLFGLPRDAWPALLAAMLAGTPALSLVGAVGAALTLGARRGAVLMPLLALPLCLPVLVFGAAAVDAAARGLAAGPHLLVLAALLTLAAGLAPWAAAAALRQAGE